MNTHMNFTAWTRKTQNLEYNLRKATREKNNREIKRLRAQLIDLVNTHA